MAFNECTEYPPTEPHAQLDGNDFALGSPQQKIFSGSQERGAWKSRQLTALSGKPNECRPGRPRPAGELRSPIAVPTQPGQTQGLFGIIQGGMDSALRKNLPSAPSKSDSTATPSADSALASREPSPVKLWNRTIDISQRQAALPHGSGHSRRNRQICNLGIDMMDCVLPTRAARHGLLFTSKEKFRSSRPDTPATRTPSTRVLLPGLRPLLPRLLCAIFIR